ncbi:MAG: YihY/virulence factor BrkB family protein [Niabella sp.]
MMNLKKSWTILKLSFGEISHNRILKLSAALAYYTIFSLPGLIIVMIWVGDTFYSQGHTQIESSVFQQITALVGEQTAQQIQTTIQNASAFPGKGFARMLGIIMLVFGATSVFAEIQDSINMIWRLKAKPKKGKGWLKLIIDRLLSFSVVISLGFLLLVSLIANVLMDLLIDSITRIIPESQVMLAYVSNMILTFLITSFLFGLIFKVLPDARIKWKAVRAGAFATALLFMIGKFLIGFYLGQNKMSSAYGAAGSVIIILLWVYYSAIILYFGAAYTRVYAIHNNMNIYPTQYAVWVEQIERERHDAIQDQHAAPVATSQQDKDSPMEN